MNPYEIINEFIRIHHLDEQNPNVLGIIFYGSTKYRTNKINSDIDLLIVTNSSKNYKGVSYHNDVKVEYFEKSFDYLLEQIHCMKHSLDYSLLSIFKNGEILFSKDYALEYLTDEALFQDIASSKNCIISYSLLNDWLEFFNRLSETSPLRPYIYHNLLEFIRKVFHEENGFSKLPIMKVYELYQNKNYAMHFYCAKLPPQEFRECFLNLMTSSYQPSEFQTLLSTISTKDSYHETPVKIYHPNELKYKSTITQACVSKVISFIEKNHPALEHYYYIALEKLRILYCNINGINASIDHFGHSYDEKFLQLFQNCIHNIDSDSLINLFTFVSAPLKMNYKNYKVFEYHN